MTRWLAWLTLSLVVACAGEDGADGLDGAAGADGRDGKDGEDGLDGVDGADGADGEDGADGLAGADGVDGADGADGQDGAPGPIVSEEAAWGLEISPVPLNLDGLDTRGVERVGRGSYIVNAVADCAGCHANPANPYQFLAGGAAFGPIPDGYGGYFTVFTRNLTPDETTGLSVTDEDDFVELMRTGRDFQDPSGTTSLVVMPWATYRWMSDEDLKSVFAYLRAIPAEVNPVPPDQNRPPIPPAPFTGDFDEGEVVRPLPPQEFDDGFAERGLALHPLADYGDFDALSPADQALYARGSYLVNAIGNCNDCHTPGARNPVTLQVNTTDWLTGGVAFRVPPPLDMLIGQKRTMSQNLAGDLHGFFGSEPLFDFVGILNTGTHVEDGTFLPIGFPMPVEFFRNMTLDDKTAMYTYLANVRTTGSGNDVRQQGTAWYCDANVPCRPGSTCDLAHQECVNDVCASDADCGACQTCDVGGTDACLAADPYSFCVLTAF